MAELDQTRDDVKREKVFTAEDELVAEQTAAATGASHEGLENLTGKAERAAGKTASGARHTVSNTLKSAGGVGDEVIGVARDVLKGVVVATEEVGSGLVSSVEHVAKEVVHGVGQVGGTAVHTLTELLVGIVGGVKTVVGEAMPRKSARAEGRESSAGIVERKRGEAGEPASRTTVTEVVREEETMVH